MSPRPGSLLFLVQGSEEMDPLSRGAVRLHVEQALDYLLNRRGRNASLRVGVVGYCVREDRLAFTSLLPEGSDSPVFIPLDELGAAGRRQVRLDRLSFAAKAPPAEGLAHAHFLLQRWLVWNHEARPPVVIHCGAGDSGYGSAHARISRSLRLLGPASGAIGLAHQVFAGGSDLRFLGGEAHSLPGKFRRLYRHSSPMLLRGPEDAQLTHALAINADSLPLLRGLLKQTRPLRPAETPAPARMRVLSVPRRGRTEQENEDIVACKASHGLVVLSDGASEGACSREWARLLVETYLANKPDPTNREQYITWLDRCRDSWQEQVRLTVTTPGEVIEAEKKGTAGTFLAWQLGKLTDGTYAWQGWAVGDSCLFWVRENRLRASFPLAHSRHFSAPPCLLGTWPQKPEPAPLFGAGVCRPGDLFVLATDALARYLLRRVERGHEPDWNDLEKVSEEDWRLRVEGWRDKKRMVNDDCTLVLARVQR